MRWPWKKPKATFKPLDKMTPEEIEAMTKQAKREALHRAVDRGLFDDFVREVKQ